MSIDYECDDASPLGINRIREFSLAHPEMTDEEVGMAMTRKMSKEELRRYAAARICSWAQMMRRDVVRKTERAAETIPGMSERQREQVAAEQAREEMFRSWYDNPEPLLGTCVDRKRFRTWLGDRFGEWHERGRSLMAERSERDLVFFESDWHQAGAPAYFAERRAREVRRLVDDTARDVRLETTRELLSAMFALGDGTKVTWGSATTGQHEQRIDLLQKNAAGVVGTAARHRAAVRMIREAGVKCLDELVAEEAA